jgi:hypothetical protein
MGFVVEGGTYEVSGSIITIKPPGQKEGKGRIKELTDDRLVIKDDAEPKELVLKKRKGGAAPNEGGPKLKVGDIGKPKDAFAPRDNFPKLDQPFKDFPKLDQPLKGDFPKLDQPFKDFPKLDRPLKDQPKDLPK